MFVCSFKASKIKILFSAALCAVIAMTAILLMPDTEHTVTVNGVQHDKKIRFDGIKTEADLVNFAGNLGYSLEEEAADTAEVKLPSKFDAVLEAYNDLQKSQGFNLAKYKNKTVTRYTFRVTALPDGASLPNSGETLLTLILYRDKIIGGDLFFSADGGEVAAFLK